MMGSARRSLGKEIGPGTVIAGWAMLCGLALLIDLAPMIIIICIVYSWKKNKKRKEEEAEPIVVYPLEHYAPEVVEGYDTTLESAGPVDVIEDAVSALRNLGTNKGIAEDAVRQAIEGGETTLERILTKALQLRRSNGRT